MNEEEKNASLIIVFVAEVRFFFLLDRLLFKLIYLTFSRMQQTDIEYVAVIAEKIKKQ